MTIEEAGKQVPVLQLHPYTAALVFTDTVHWQGILQNRMVPKVKVKLEMISNQHICIVPYV